MSQNSLILPTTGTVSGLQMTQDVNAALDTLNTLASGASAPGTAEPGQLWHDTTNNILKLRSLDNTTWIPLLSVNESTYQASFSATTAAPGTNTTQVATTAFVQTAIALKSYIAGLALSNDATSPTSVIDIAAGACTSDDGSTFMSLAAFTKNCTAAWAVGSSNGALDTGSIAASSWYHVYVIERTDTGVVDVLLSLSPTAPTMPTSYTKKRRIGSILTDGSAHIVAFSLLEINGGGTLTYWGTQVLDVSVTNLGTTRTLYTLSVPSGIKTQPLVRYSTGGASPVAILLTSGDETDVGVSSASYAFFSGAPGFDLSDTGTFVLGINGFLTTNASGQIGARAAGAGSGFYLVTRGYIDFRRS